MPHLFVRFWNCNLNCRYCDTDVCGPYAEYTTDRLSAEVGALLSTAGPFHAVSLTGGEPLLWARFLKRWLPRVRERGQATYLETNGTLAAALEELLPWIDIVAMDIKPPSATGDRPVWEENEAFLRLSHRAGGTVFVKIVVTAQTDEAELRRAFDLVASVDRRIPLVLQPVTPWGPIQESPAIEQISRWRHQARERLQDVRVIPQIQRVLGVR